MNCICISISICNCICICICWDQPARRRQPLDQLCGSQREQLYSAISPVGEARKQIGRDDGHSWWSAGGVGRRMHPHSGTMQLLMHRNTGTMQSLMHRDDLHREPWLCALMTRAHCHTYDAASVRYYMCNYAQQLHISRLLFFCVCIFLYLYLYLYLQEPSCWSKSQKFEAEIWLRALPGPH